jgi:hypothetical protein
MSEILEAFMDYKDFEAISEYCDDIEGLTQSQIDLIMNQDIHLYYKTRCHSSENPEDAMKPIKIELQKTDNYKVPAEGSETEDELSSPNKNYT